MIYINDNFLNLHSLPQINNLSLEFFGGTSLEVEWGQTMHWAFIPINQRPSNHYRVKPLQEELNSLYLPNYLFLLPKSMVDSSLVPCIDTYYLYCFSK